MTFHYISNVRGKKEEREKIALNWTYTKRALIWRTIDLLYPNGIAKFVELRK